MWFQRLIDISSVASTETTLKEALSGLVPELGFDCYAYLNVQPARIYAVSNYPAEWQKRYLGRDSARAPRADIRLNGGRELQRCLYTS
ncbi:autoinducer binding domain-containing protein [Mesorhizobium sp.]|uniref:autoinducer binding domain-containing protein n=1 Tax=Mesorhizobium sp. TaxID=1871066 RepID=UPI002600ECDA|nr:autoinducer binding domain-containing protein [Mesorhizobium sp.]